MILTSTENQKIKSPTRRLFIFWLPGRVGLRNKDLINSECYKDKPLQKSVIEKGLKDNKAHEVNKLKKHIIHKAIEWKRMLDDGSATSYSEIAQKEELTRARVTQIMNLLKLPWEMQEFLVRLEDPREIRRYSERKLRGIRP
ncbi:MAG: hypothetical protein SV375_07320 [Thermodesulfobacteriota bacterium]|nr:hypothetical protein [Thermodesulfobacteriota bacterium]